MAYDYQSVLSGLGLNVGSSTGDQGAFLGEGTQSGIPAWDTGASPGFLDSIGSAISGLMPQTEQGKAAAALGLAGLLTAFDKGGNKSVGYQYGVPLYTAKREMLPIPATHRPGQGGISYFTPMQYEYTGVTPEKAEQFLQLKPPTTAPAAPYVPPPTTYPYQTQWTDPGFTLDGLAAGGGIGTLAAAGKHIRGPGDGVSDDIPAQMPDGGPAKLADGEFVIPARVVAEIGNGSNEAGARKLYEFLDKVEAMARKAKRGEPSGADKQLNRLA